MQELSFNQVGIAVGLMILFSGFAVNMAMLFKINSKQKREVSFEEECASKTEFDEHRRLAVESRRRMHEEIRGIEKSVASLTTTVGRTQDDVAKLDTKIDGVKETLRTLPGEIIADLRNSGALS